MKKFTVVNAKYVVETGENEDPHFMKFEIEGDEDMQVSDGYHTMDELYEHRITLFIALCEGLDTLNFVSEKMGMAWRKLLWRSKLHSDGSSFEGWFILGVGKEPGKQISYHLPLSKWDETNFAETLEKAPKWDGHTSADVLERLKNLS